MNKTMFYTGLSIFILEVLGLLIYFLAKVDSNLLSQIIVISAIAILNLFAFIIMIFGIVSKDEEKLDEY